VIERIISDGRGEELLGAAVAEHGKGAVLATVHEIQDRHDAAREVERSLLELHQVCRAATRSWARRSSCKCLCIGIIILLLLVLLVIVPIATSFRKS